MIYQACLQKFEARVRIKNEVVWECLISLLKLSSDHIECLDVN
jgi:hypothetical protein